MGVGTGEAYFTKGELASAETTEPNARAARPPRASLVLRSPVSARMVARTTHTWRPVCMALSGVDMFPHKTFGAPPGPAPALGTPYAAMDTAPEAPASEPVQAGQPAEAEVAHAEGAPAAEAAGEPSPVESATRVVLLHANWSGDHWLIDGRQHATLGASRSCRCPSKPST